MKGSVVAKILVLTFVLSTPARAQVMIDLSLITCKQFLK